MDNGSTHNERYSQLANNMPAPPPLSASLLRAQGNTDDPTIAFIPTDARKADGMPTLSTAPGVRERFSFDIDMSDEMARQNKHARMMTIVLAGFAAVALVIGTIFVFAVMGHDESAASHASTMPVAFATLTTTPGTLAGFTTVTAFPEPTQTAIGTPSASATQPTHSIVPTTATPQPTTIPPTATPVPTLGWNAVVTKNGPTANGYRTAIILDEYYDPQQCSGWCNHWRGRDVIFIPSAAANNGTLSMAVAGYSNAAGNGAPPAATGSWSLQNYAYPANQIDMFTGPEIFTPCANVSFVFSQGATSLFNFNLDSIHCKP